VFGVLLLAAVLLPPLLVLTAGAASFSRRLDAYAVAPWIAFSVPSLPKGFRYDAVQPGPLQLVDGEGPTTKVCPECSGLVLHSARACKHCGATFAPVLHIAG
jgi:hypothetical protein